MAEPSVHAGDVSEPNPAPQGDLPPESVSDVWVAASRLYADMRADPTGGSQIPILRYAYVLGLLMGHQQRLETENRHLREALGAAGKMRGDGASGAG